MRFTDSESTLENSCQREGYHEFKLVCQRNFYSIIQHAIGLSMSGSGGNRVTRKDLAASSPFLHFLCDVLYLPDGHEVKIQVWLRCMLHGRIIGQEVAFLTNGFYKR